MAQNVQFPPQLQMKFPAMLRRGFLEQVQSSLPMLALKLMDI